MSKYHGVSSTGRRKTAKNGPEPAVLQRLALHDRTGLDNNSDQISNDRPAGVGRNSLRGDGSFNLSGFFVYDIPPGQRKVQLPPGIMIQGGPNANFDVTTMQADPLPRFRMGIVVNA